MHQVSQRDIQDLDDSDLRDLVAKLCDAALRARGISTAALTAGGPQEAPDGGVDVRVRVTKGRVGGYLPRKNTVFQVKRHSIGPAALLREMQKDKKARPLLKQLAAQGGAYIVVSGKDSVSDSSYEKRLNAMRAACKGIAGIAKLHLDFYDGDRIARWVNEFPGLKSWVLTCIGRPLTGWQAYGNWSSPSEPVKPYLLDARARLNDSRSANDSEAQPLAQGIARLRETLAKPGSVVRLVGLSGMGKTRLAQALFEDIPGTGPALMKAHVYYTDIGHEPNPGPRELIARAVANHERCIVVVDNCTPLLHRDVASVVTGSTVSALTIEYDVRGDDPEYTEVFRLDPASPEIVSELVAQRHPFVSQVDREHIARLSGGNARIALALARTIKSGESVSRFSDAELFERLFHQRRAKSDQLYLAALVCSLAYSFDGETLAGADSELVLLSNLLGLEAPSVYGALAELGSRELIQSRGCWRAVLPQALANYLASEALKRVPPAEMNALVEKAPMRLMRSIARRLGYLHSNDVAAKVAGQWVEPGGWLSKLSTLSEYELESLKNVAPVIPEKVLTLLEEAISQPAELLIIQRSGRHRAATISILRAIAYDVTHFDRCIQALAKVAAAAKVARGSDTARDAFGELFHIVLSGTMALPHVRLAQIKQMIGASDSGIPELGMHALAAMLQSSHFSSSHQFEFGARPRSHGYRPRSQREINEWFGPCIALCAELARSGPHAEKARTILGAAFRGLWSAGQYEPLEAAARTLGHEWVDGWNAIRSTLRYDGKGMDEAVRKRLKALAGACAPTDLMSRVRAYVMNRATGDDVTDGEAVDVEKAYARAAEIAKELGQQAATRLDDLGELWPALTTDYLPRGFQFGLGLGADWKNAPRVWRALRKYLGDAGQKANAVILSGVLRAINESKPDMAASLLDRSLTDPALAPLFVDLQCAVPLDSAGVQRLVKSLRLGRVPIVRYGLLASGGITRTATGSDLRRLLNAIASKSDGLAEAIDILHMHLFALRTSGLPIDSQHRRAAAELIKLHTFADKTPKGDHELAEIIKVALPPKEATKIVRQVCKKLTSGPMARYTLWSREELLASLFDAAPTAALDSLLGQVRHGEAQLRYLSGANRRSIFGNLSDEQLLKWARRKDKQFRLNALARTATVVKVDAESYEWTSLAHSLIAEVADKKPLLDALAARLHPTSWTGPRSAVLAKSKGLLTVLAHSADSTVREWTATADLAMQQAIDRELEHEKKTTARFE